MKIVFISGGYPPDLDGIGDYTQCLFQEMGQQMGTENVYVITGGRGIAADEDSNVMRIARTWSFRDIVRVMQEIRYLKPEIVHIQYPSSGFGRSPFSTLLPLLLRLTNRRVRVFCTIHEFINKTSKGRARLLSSMVFCHGIIIVSEIYRASILPMWPSLSGRIRYVPIGSNIKRQKIALAQPPVVWSAHGWGQQDFVMAYFGIVRAGKGVEDLIDAFLIAREHVRHLRLVIIGGIQNQVFHERLVYKLGAADALQSALITGRVTQMEASEYLAAADLCVFPFEDGVSTKRSGFMAAVEHGRPIVTTRPVQAMAELVDGHNIFLVAAGDVSQLARKIVEVATDPFLLARLQRNVEALRELYSWQTIASAHLALYDSAGHL